MQPRTLAWAIAAAIVAFTPELLAAEAIACPPATPVIQVTLMNPEPPLSREISVNELHARSGQPRTTNSHHLGLTELRMEWRSKLDLRVAAGSDGACAVVAAVRLVLAHVTHRILIARELPEGGCLYREVEVHERRHVAVNRRTLRDILPVARQALKSWAERAEARATTPTAAGAQLRENLSQALAPVVVKLQEARALAHRGIDTPDEYRRLWGSCATDQVRLQDRLRAR